MSTDAASICYIMKDAAFAAGDKIVSRESRQEIHDVLIGQLLTGWFAKHNSEAVIWSDSLTAPMLMRRKDNGYALSELTRDISDYDGPCFAVGGTNGGAAFEHGLFEASISIAYLDDGQLQAAVVYDPVHVELFHAVSGLGAYLNGKRISPTSTKRLCDAWVSIGQTVLRVGGIAVRSLISEAGHIRMGAGCGLELCYTACGRTDASVIYNVAFVDYAAGLLVVKEAGAALMNKSGGPCYPLQEYGERNDITAVCPGIAGELSKCLSGKQ